MNKLRIIAIFVTFLHIGSTHRSCNLYSNESKAANPNLQVNIESVEQRVDTVERSLPTSCKEILDSNNGSSNGVYQIRDSSNISYPVYCDMLLGGGGWTLVASIHENNIGGNTGRCTTGDRWSSETGNEQGSQAGADSWMNQNIFGLVASVTSDDYKNQGYFDLTARDVMIWQVPNQTPLSNYSDDSYLQYRTSDGFLSRYGGNLYQLFTDHYPIKSGAYTRYTGNGPAISVIYDRGTAAESLSHLGPNIQPHLDPGYIQFRAINWENSAYALCPGIRVQSSGGDVEHACIGSTADNADVNYCGDFSAFKLDGSDPGRAWNADLTFLESAILIFYR